MTSPDIPKPENITVQTACPRKCSERKESIVSRESFTETNMADQVKPVVLQESAQVTWLKISGSFTPSFSFQRKSMFTPLAADPEGKRTKISALTSPLTSKGLTNPNIENEVSSPACSFHLHVPFVLCLKEGMPGGLTEGPDSQSSGRGPRKWFNPNGTPFVS